MSAFRLSKWYLDVVGDDGEVIIAYSADARWGGLHLSYASVLRQRAGEATCIDSTVRSVDAPVVVGDHIVWSASRLRCSGVWYALAPEMSAVLFESPEGMVAWRCRQPRACVELDAGGRRMRGLGYVEELTMTIPPWRMPIDELAWGRFQGERSTIVWIDWRGAHVKRLVWFNGALLDGACVDQRSVGNAAARLAIDEGRVLRSGRLGKTVFAGLPAIDERLPLRILATDETKWCARGEFEHAKRRDGGWVIHEVVRWPRR